MSEKPQENLEVELTVPERPTETDAYTRALEQRHKTLAAELAASPGPEAKGVCWCDVYGQGKDADGNLHVVRINLTQRSSISAQAALEEMLEVLKFAKTKKLYPWVPTGVQVNARGSVRQDEPPQPAELPRPASPLPETEVLPPAEPLPAAPVSHDEPAVTPSGSFKCVQLETAPVTGGKVALKFFSNEKVQPVDKFPSLTNTMSIQKAISTLAAVGNFNDAHFAQPHRYQNLNLVVTWEQGKEIANQPGKHYKNIKSISPA